MFRLAISWLPAFYVRLNLQGNQNAVCGSRHRVISVFGCRQMSMAHYLRIYVCTHICGHECAARNVNCSVRQLYEAINMGAVLF